MIADTDWMGEAACSGMDINVFFDEGYAQQASLNLCRMCPVSAQCLAWEMPFERSAGQRWGVFGGMTPAQRGTLARRARRLAVAS